jgi:hypothetical protein
LASKPRGLFSPVWSQNLQLRFVDLGLKITVTVSWFEPQNQVGFSLSVALQNRQREDGVGHALRSSDLFYMEASRFRVFQSGLKTSMGVTVGDAHGIIAEVV